MRILTEPLDVAALRAMASASFWDMVKAVVDVERELLALDAELHSDLEALLLDSGSRQEHLWGINLYPDLPQESLVEFDSMINLRPSQGNLSRGVDDEQARRRIMEVVTKWLRT